MSGEMFTKVSEAGKRIPEDVLIRLRSDESVQVEIGVKGKSGHWGHVSQAGHRGGSLPKDGQGSLSFPKDKEAPQSSAPFETAVDTPIEGAGKYFDPNVRHPFTKEERDRVDAEIKGILAKIPKDWATGVKIVLHPDKIDVPWGNYEQLGFDSDEAQVNVFVGHIRMDMGVDPTPKSIHTPFIYPWGDWYQYTATCVAHEIAHHAWNRQLSEQMQNTFAVWNEQARKNQIKFPRQYSLWSAKEFFTTNYEAWIRGHTDRMEPAVTAWFEEHAKLKRKTESVHLEIGVKGKSGHWKHQSQKGHKGGSLPKDGQLSLTLDTPAPKMTAPKEPPAGMLDTAINAVIHGSPEYLLSSYIGKGGRDLVDAEIKSVLEKIPKEWADRLSITLLPDRTGVPWAEYRSTLGQNEIEIFVGHIKEDIGDDPLPHSVHGMPDYPWGTWVQYTGTCLAHEISHNAWKWVLTGGEQHQFEDWWEEAQRDQIKTPRVYGLMNSNEFFATNYEAWIRGLEFMVEPKVWNWFEKNAKPKPKHESFRVTIKREGASLVEYGLSIRAGRCGHAEHGGPTPLSDQMPPLFPNMRLIEYGVKGKSGHWKHQSQKGHKGGSLPKDGQGSLPLDTKSTAPPEMKSLEQNIDDLVAKIYANTADMYNKKVGASSKTLDELYDFKAQIVQVLEQIPSGWGEGLNKLTIRSTRELPGGVPKKMEGDENIAGEYYFGDKNIDIWFEVGYDSLTNTGIRGIVTHEFGHHVWSTKLFEVDRNRFKNWFDRAGRGFEKYPTKYSLKNVSEFFSENLRYYVIGQGQERLSQDVFDWMERNVGAKSFRGIQPLKPTPQYPKGLPDRETVKKIRRFKGGSAIWR